MKLYLFFLALFFSLSNLTFAQLQLDWVNKYASTSDSLAGYSSCVDFSTITNVASNDNSIWSIGYLSTNDNVDYYGPLYIDFSQNLNTYGLLNSDYETCGPSNSSQKFIKSINPETGTLNWVKKLNIKGYIRTLVEDNYGNYYISGFIDDTTNFNFFDTYPWNDQIISPVSLYSGFIAKYSNYGTLLWVKVIDGNGGYINDVPKIQDICFDSENNLYATGTFRGDYIDFDPGSGTAIETSSVNTNNSSNFLSDIFILKLDQNGNFDFVKTFPSPNYAYSYDIDVDVDGNMIIKASTLTEINLDPTTNNFNFSSDEIIELIVKLDSETNILWANQTNFASNFGNGLVDDFGDYYYHDVFTESSGVSNFTDIPILNIDSYDYTEQNQSVSQFYKLDLAGNYIWASLVDGIVNDYCFDENFDLFIISELNNDAIITHLSSSGHLISKTNLNASDSIKIEASELIYASNSVYASGSVFRDIVNSNNQFLGASLDFDLSLDTFNIYFDSRAAFIAKYNECLIENFDTIISCDSINWNESIYTESGIYTYSFINTEGCVVNETLNLTVNYDDTSYIEVNSCESYQWNGETYTESGIYFYSELQNPQTIDGFSYFGLLNESNYYISDNLTSWNAASLACIEAGGNLVSINSEEENNFIGANLSNNSIWIGLNQDSDDSDWQWSDGTDPTFFNWRSDQPNGTNQNCVDFYFDASLTGSEFENQYNVWTDANCNDNYYYILEIPVIELTTVNGCDSVAVLNLTINQPETSYIDITACDSYSWNDSTYTQSGTYSYSGASNNYSMSFDGSQGQIIDCGASINQAINNEMTIIFTVNPNQDAFINGKWLFGQNENGSDWFGCRYDHETGGENFIFRRYSVNTQYDVTLSFDMPENEIHTFAYTYLQGDKARIYKDGIEIANEACTLPPLPINPSSFYLGGDQLDNIQGMNTAFSGLLDDVHIWNTALSQQEIQNYMTCPPTGNESGLVGYWNFEEGMGNTAYDLSSNGNDGIINGAAYSTNTPEQSCQLTTVNGCDSVAVLNLTINNSNTGVDTQAHCDTYTWIDGETYTSSNNNATWTLTNAAGCDSIITLDLTIYNSNTVVDTQVHCDTYTWIDGNSYTVSNNTATHTLTNAIGCDSVVTLDLTINYSSPSEFTDQNIDPDSQYELGELIFECYLSMTSYSNCTSPYLDGGNYILELSGQYCLGSCWGGNSTDAAFNINSPWSETPEIPAEAQHWSWNEECNDDNICQTYRPTPNEFNTERVYYYPFVSNGGVETIYGVNDCCWGDNSGGLTLRIYNNLIENNSELITCDSYEWNGVMYTESGFYTYETQTIAGCDSIATLNLTINYSDESSEDITACDNYDWNGITYTESGTYTYETQTIAGCDSVATLNLTINYSDESSEDITACDNYDWNGITYTESGTYTYETQTIAGCDSVASLNLTINYSDESSEDITACDSYEWNGTTYMQSGTYSYNSVGGSNNYSLSFDGVDDYVQLGNSNLLPSNSITLSLWFNASNPISSTNEIFISDVSWTTYTIRIDNQGQISWRIQPNAGSGGNVTFISTTGNGVNYNDNNWHYISCTWDGNQMNMFIDGIQVPSNPMPTSFSSVSFTNDNASIGKFPNTNEVFNGNLDNFEIWNTALTQQEIQQYMNCPPTGNESGLVGYWNFEEGSGNTAYDQTSNGNDGTINGATYDTNVPSQSCSLTNTNGCDSTAILNLTINNTNSGVDSQVHCDTYTWIDGNTYTTSNNTATWTLTNAAGCDSVVTLDLTINTTTFGTDTQEHCDTYTWIDGNSYTVSNNTATHTLTNVAGCDSIVTLDLIINNSNTGEDTQTACDTYTWIDGNTYTSSNNTSTHTLTNVAGCDSVVTLDLTINNSNTGVDSQVHCDAYTWIDGNTYTSSNNTATHTLTNATGCDSVVTLDLTINNINTGVDIKEHCDTYTWIDGNTYTESNNTATFTLTNSNNCDSIVTLDLIINNSDNTSSSVTACDEFTWDAQTYSESGEYTNTYTNSNGCDSTHTLNLTINYTTYGTDTQEHCDEYTWIDGNTYTESNNTATFTLANSNNCDSIVTLDLIINNSDNTSSSVTACDEFTWDGQTYTESGEYTNTYTNSNGCDSTHTLNLTINYTTYGTDTQEHCDEYTWIDGNTYTESNNTATFTLANSNNCDSIVTLDLIINNSDNTSSSVTACDEFTWDGQTYTESGDYTNTYTNANGCDSTHTLNLTINYTTYGTDTQEHCDEYTWIDGNTYTESNNTATFTLTNSNNCDSIVTLDLIINNSDNTSSSVTACDEFTWDGQTYTVSGEYTNTYTNANGCDSTHTLNLTINYTTYGTDTQEHCDEYTWIDGNTYTESNNTATFTLANSNNCDSIVTLDLLITQSSSSYDTVVVCDSYDWNGNTYTESGNYVYTSSNTIGCDSVANLDLFISQLENLVIDGEQIGYTETDNNTYSISNSNASSTYFWNLSNNLGIIESGNANNSEITISWGVNDSETTLCVYEQDEYSCEGEESCVTIDVKRPTSIDDIEESLLSIYPNPFKNQTTVSFSNPAQFKAILKLIDSRGRTVRNYDGITGDSIIIKKEELSEGLYYIQLNLNNNVIRKPMVVQ